MTDISKSIGEELIRESQGPQPKKRGISDDLFPYILVASMNGMSARAISRWLDEKQEIKLSAAMVAKVIRESDKRCIRLFEEMYHRETHLLDNEPIQYVRAPDTARLFDKHEFESHSPYHLSEDEKIFGDQSGMRKSTQEAYDYIMEGWFSLPEQFRNEVQRVIANQAQEAKNENADSK